MDKGLFLIETHLKTGRPIGELAKAHGVSRGWLYKLLRRYRLEGPEAVAPRSRRPKSSPTRIAALYEDEIVRLRKELIDGGYDGGAETIRFHMATPGHRAVDIHDLPGSSSPGASSPSHPRSVRRARTRGSWPTCRTRPGRPT